MKALTLELGLPPRFTIIITEEASLYGTLLSFISFIHNHI